MTLFRLWLKQFTACRRNGHYWERYELHGDQRLNYGARYVDQCLTCRKIKRVRP